jgi:hypothetical protein
MTNTNLNVTRKMYYFVQILYAGKRDYFLTLGTMHGNFSSNYTEEIPQLMKNLQAEKKLVIFGGDTNHPPTYNIDGLLVVSEDNCTNFYTNYAKISDDKTKFTSVYLHDDRPELAGQNIIKAYDGFFVVPPKNKSVNITIYGEHSWEKVLNEVGEMPLLATSHVTKSWVTKPGIPVFRLEQSTNIFN